MVCETSHRSTKVSRGQPLPYQPTPPSSHIEQCQVHGLPTPLFIFLWKRKCCPYFFANPRDISESEI